MRIHSITDIEQFFEAALAENDTDLSTHAYVSSLRDLMTNGGVSILSFAPSPPLTQENVFGAFFSFGINGPDVCKSLLRTRAIQSAIHRLNGVIAPSSPLEEWSCLPSYQLDGFLAQLLKQGGAYEQFEGSGKVAKRLAAKFCSLLFKERYEDVNVFISGSPWSTWFRGIAWDATVLLFDRRKNLIWLMMVTDTD